MDVDSFPDSVVVKGYAYESAPGVGIHAGDRVTNVQEIHQTDGSYFQLSHNPSTPSHITHVYFSSDKPGEYKLEIVNTLGDVLRTHEGMSVMGYNNVRLPLENLAAGNYFIRLTTGDKVQHRKVMVVE